MFQNRLNICQVAGIKIGIDFSWLFIAVLLSWSLAVGYFPLDYPNLSASTYWLMGISGMLGLFVCILLHELGHALVAKRYGIPTAQITLFIFGGLAEIKKEPQSPKIEFWITIAGPLVSFALAFIMYVVTGLLVKNHAPSSIAAVTYYLAWINALIAAFNLIPAFPLDGGRILRAILWWSKDNLAWATAVSTRCGLIFGTFLIFLGLFMVIFSNIIGGFWLMIIGLYLRYAAYSSRTQFYVHKTLAGEKVVNYMTKNPISAPPDITVQQFIDDYIYKSHHHFYPITENGDLLGYVSLRQVKEILPEDRPKVRLRAIMAGRTQFETVTGQTSAEDALSLMNQAPEGGTLLVVEGTKLVGLLTPQDMLKLISLKLELEGGGR